MRPTDIDRNDRKRLFASVAVTGSLYALLFFILLFSDAHGSFPSRMHTSALPLALRLTASVVSAQTAAELKITKRQNETIAANRIGRTIPSSEVSVQEKTGAHAIATETAKLETAQASDPDGTGSAGGDGDIGSASSVGSDSGNETSGKNGGSGIVSGAGNTEFISWFDSAIRRTLTYPERARKRNLEGTVAIIVDVSADGKNCRASIAGTSGSETLDRAALDFVKSLFPSPVSPERPFSGTLKIKYVLVRNGR